MIPLKQEPIHAICDDQISIKQIDMDQLNRNFIHFACKMGKMQEQIDTQKEQIDTQNEQIDTQKEQIDTQKEQLDIQKEQQDTQSKAYDRQKNEYKEQIDTQRKAYDRQKNETKFLLNKCQKTDTKLMGATVNIEILEIQIDRMNQKDSQQTQDIKDLNGKVQKLTINVDLIQKSQFFCKVSVTRGDFAITLQNKVLLLDQIIRNQLDLSNQQGINLDAICDRTWDMLGKNLKKNEDYDSMSYRDCIILVVRDLKESRISFAHLRTVDRKIYDGDDIQLKMIIINPQYTFQLYQLKCKENQIQSYVQEKDLLLFFELMDYLSDKAWSMFTLNKTHINIRANELLENLYKKKQAITQIKK